MNSNNIDMNMQASHQTNVRLPIAKCPRVVEGLENGTTKFLGLSYPNLANIMAPKETGKLAKLIIMNAVIMGH